MKHKGWRSDDSWELGQTVFLNGNEHTITDIDYGYGVLHLDGNHYSAPGDPQNDGIVARMSDCVPNKEIHSQESEGER